MGRAAVGWATGSPYHRSDRILGLVAMILVDLQLTLGILLYVISPRVAGALADPGMAMGQPLARQVMLEHPLLMMAAVIAIHAGFALAKRGTDDRRRHRAAALGFGVGAALAIAGIPWR